MSGSQSVSAEQHATPGGPTMPVGPHPELLTEKVAIDCEMMRSNVGQVLGRISIVNYEGETIFDTFVCYPEPIIITKIDKRFSGIGWEDIDPENGAQLFTEVQSRLIELLHGRIVVGHDVKKDLREISMNLSAEISRLERTVWNPIPQPIKFDITLRDTQKHNGYRKYAKPGAYQGPSLKDLAVAVLGRQIKQGRVSSVEDAVATMEIYRKAEDAIDQEQGGQSLARGMASSSSGC